MSNQPGTMRAMPTGKGLIGQAGVEPVQWIKRYSGGSDGMSWEMIFVLFCVLWILSSQDHQKPAAMTPEPAIKQALK